MVFKFNVTDSILSKIKEHDILFLFLNAFSGIILTLELFFGFY